MQGHILRQRLEPNGGPASHGPSSQVGPDEAGDGLPANLQGHHRGEDLTEGEREVSHSANGDPGRKLQGQGRGLEAEGGRLVAARRRGDREEVQRAAAADPGQAQ